VRLHHLGWVVKDIGRGLRQFERDGAHAVTAAIADPIQRVTVQFLFDPHSPVLWELIAPLGSLQDSPLASRLSRGGGLDHACFELDESDGSIDVVVQQEVARGSVVLCQPTFAAAFNRKVAFVYRPSGRVVEFVEARAEGDTV
jgi:methylmalonyl-CoA/ethylmalonyl-CoA epimerase